jgi:hypothetical protein
MTDINTIPIFTQKQKKYTFWWGKEIISFDYSFWELCEKIYSLKLPFRYILSIDTDFLCKNQIEIFEFFDRKKSGPNVFLKVDTNPSCVSNCCLPLIFTEKDNSNCVSKFISYTSSMNRIDMLLSSYDFVGLDHNDL